MDKEKMNKTDDLPFSQACENNKQAILKVLLIELQSFNHILEIGSGTGQHSVCFAPHLPHLQWQTSDVPVNHQAIKAWHQTYPVANLHPPLAFDLNNDSIPISQSTHKIYDAVFTANTLHIISWALVQQLFKVVGDALPIDGKLIVYGPFNENGHYTSEGNRQFDLMLRQNSLEMSIRDKENVIALAKKNKLTLSKIYPMPTNNQLLVFVKKVIENT